MANIIRVKRAQKFTKKALALAERFMHIEASSGIVLLLASIAALYMANSTHAAFYEHLWHIPIGLQFNETQFSWDLHFWVNDILMTLFFLTVGVEIKQEIVLGALASLRQALLPLIAAIGGVLCPAFIFIIFNKNFPTIEGWAIPTATDIAFAVGILALLGKSIPHNVRIILLSLAIIDDIIAIIIITVVYSNHIELTGLYFIIGALALILLFQQMGFDFAPLYSVPGILLWFGLMKTGIHPSIAGVILGLLTPTKVTLQPNTAFALYENFFQKLTAFYKKEPDLHDKYEKTYALKNIQNMTRHIVAPCERVQEKLHPWVAFVIMPLFAFANAGVSFSEINFQQPALSAVFIGIFLGLVIGKPLGIFLSSFIAVKCNICRLPQNVSWASLVLVGMLAGIGFTMAIFVTLLAFTSATYISLAKISILLASATSALLGILYGFFLKKSYKTDQH